jgi:hypothetical protein
LDRDLSPVANVLLNSLAKPLSDKLFSANKKQMEKLMKRWEKSFDKSLSAESLEKIMHRIKFFFLNRLQVYILFSHFQIIIQFILFFLIQNTFTFKEQIIIQEKN